MWCLIDVGVKIIRIIMYVHAACQSVYVCSMHVCIMYVSVLAFVSICNRAHVDVLEIFRHISEIYPFQFAVFSWIC